MPKSFTKFKTTLPELRLSGLSTLHQFLDANFSAAAFRCIFEEGDFENEQITILSFKMIPKLVSITLKTGDDLEKALLLLKEFNPNVTWKAGVVNFVQHPANNIVVVKHHLRIIDIQ